MGTDSRLLADGRYELFESIGSGGMATVYRAHDRRLGVDRAIKVLAPGYASKPTVRARFEAEARTMAVLDHPNIVRVYDVGSDDETAWIVMELIDGPSLLGRIKQRVVGVNEALQITESILNALTVAHAHGVVHRDIKPHNVLISKDGTVRITDFGIARSGGNTEDSFTKTGTVMGTWAFMAPEQRVNAKGVDHTADIYGMGATLFAMATGDTPMDLFASDLDPDMLTKVPVDLVPLIRRATRYQREERFPNAQAMLEAVDATRQRTDDSTGTIRTPRLTPPAVTRPAAASQPMRQETPNSVPTVADPESPTNVTYVPDLAESTEGVDEGIDVTVTPLPFRPHTPQPPAPETQLYPPVKATSRNDRTLLWVILILILLVGGAIRRALRAPEAPPQTNVAEPQDQPAAVEAPAIPAPPDQPLSEPDILPAVVDLPTPASPPATPPANAVAPTQAATAEPSTPPAPTDAVAPTETVASIPSTPSTPTTPLAVGNADIEHTVNGEALLGSTLAIQARIANLRPLDIQQYQMTAYFRSTQTAQYRSVPMTRIRSTWTGGIPVGPDMGAGLEYFIKAKPTDSQDGRLSVLLSGNNRDPHRVRITNP